MNEHEASKGETLQPAEASREMQPAKVPYHTLPHDETPTKYQTKRIEMEDGRTVAVGVSDDSRFLVVITRPIEGGTTSELTFSLSTEAAGILFALLGNWFTEQQPAERWRSVETDGVPEEGTLIWYANRINPARVIGPWTFSNQFPKYITHWLPIRRPEPPQESQQ